MDSASSSLTLVNNFHGRIMSSLQPTTCMIYTIKNIYILNDDLTHVPFYIRGIKYDGLLLPGSLSESKSQQEQETSEEVCTVCLEPIVSDSPNCLTTCCNHTFHISCLIPLESSQCPVCRYISITIRI